MQTITVDWRQFSVEIHHDECMGAPWKEHDMHGVVSDWTRRAKKPCERVLVRDGDSCRYYDVQASMQKAVEVWGCRKGEEAAKAVARDFERLRAWCNDEWYWVWIKVTLLDGKDKGEYETLGGIESDAGAYVNEQARNLASELLHRVVTAACC